MYLHGFLAGRYLAPITVQPHAFQCGNRVGVVNGVPATSAPKHRHYDRYDGTAEIFIEGIDAGLAQHSAAAALAPGLGTLPFDAA